MVDLGDGNDRLTLARAANTGTVSNVASITSGVGSDTIVVTGGVSVRISSGACNEMITRGDGNDVLNGEGGNDRMTGWAGKNTFLPSTGTDTIVDYAAGDKINTLIYSSFSTLSGVTAASSEVGENLVFNLGSGNTVTILGHSVAGLAALSGDFIYF